METASQLLPILASVLGGSVHDILNLYRYGSCTYGLYQEGVSDKDFVVVSETIAPGEYSATAPWDIHVFTLSEFQKMLVDHHIMALECIQHPLLETHPCHLPPLDLIKLRSTIGSVMDNAYVKAKKKLLVEKQLRLARKSMFHAFRIGHFGIEMAQNQLRVAEWDCTALYATVVDPLLPDTTEQAWQQWHAHCKPLFNKLRTQFRALAPKAVS